MYCEKLLDDALETWKLMQKSDNKLNDFGEDYSCVVKVMTATVGDLLARLGVATSESRACDMANAQAIRGSFMVYFMNGLFANFLARTSCCFLPWTTSFMALSTLSAIFSTGLFDSMFYHSFQFFQ